MTDQNLLGMEKSLIVSNPDILVIDNPDISRDEHNHPQQASTRKATAQVKEWIKSLSVPIPEDVVEDEP